MTKEQLLRFCIKQMNGIEKEFWEFAKLEKNAVEIKKIDGVSIAAELERRSKLEPKLKEFDLYKPLLELAKKTTPEVKKIALIREEIRVKKLEMTHLEKPEELLAVLVDFSLYAGWLFGSDLSSQNRTISLMGKKGAEVAHATNRDEKERVIQYWMENIDHSLSNDGAAELLLKAKVGPNKLTIFKQRTLSKIVSEAKKKLKLNP